MALGKATNPFGASWGADNTIVFGQPEGVMRVSANGGTPELLVATEKGEQVHGPQMLPGGRWVLFSLTRGSGDTRWDVAEIVAQSLESGERKVLWRGGSDARYVPTGHLIYALDDALFALPFDLERLEVSGGPVPLLAGLQRALTPANKHRHGALRRLRRRDARACGGAIDGGAGSNPGLGRSERPRGSHRRSAASVSVSANFSRRHAGGARRARSGE